MSARPPEDDANLTALIEALGERWGRQGVLTPEVDD